MSLRLDELTYEEAAERIARGAVALVPIGSTEPHGPHLGLCADVVIAEAASLRAADRLAADTSRPLVALVLPAVGYGVTDFARGFAGALSLSRETVTALLKDIGRSAIAAGFRGVVMVNAHLEPEHIGAVRDAVEGLRASGVRAAFPDNTRRPWALELGEEFRSGACHAGEYETSIVMAVRPALVRESLRRGLPDHPVSLSTAIREGKKTFREAGGERAYFGYPARAARDKGEQFLETLARMIEEAAREVMP